MAVRAERVTLLAGREILTLTSVSHRGRSGEDQKLDEQDVDTITARSNDR